MAEIKVSNLTKIYEHKNIFGKVKGETIALKNVSLTIPDGCFFCLLGESGSGKTTLMRILAGVTDYDEGDVYINKIPAETLSQKEKDMTMVSQNYALLPFKTVYENIAEPLRMLGESYDQIVEKIENVAELLGISEILTRKPRQLSGGEQQRVAIARALVRDADINFFDEPLSNLEADKRDDLVNDFKKIKKKKNSTFVYATHSLSEALMLGDQIAILENGELLSSGEPDALLKKPKNVKTFSFLHPDDGILLPLVAVNGHFSAEDIAFDKSDMPDGKYLLGVTSDELRESSDGFHARIANSIFENGSFENRFDKIDFTVQGMFKSLDPRKNGEEVILSVKGDSLPVFNAVTGSFAFLAKIG